MNGFIQIAGIRDLEEARLAAAAGVEALGFPFRLDHHAEDSTEAEAREIIAALPPVLRPVLITYLREAEEILALASFLKVRSVQLHGEVSPALGAKLKERSPDLWLIKSLVVRLGSEAGLFKEMEIWSEHADAFLTDTYDPRSGASGATGKTHDWEVSRRLAELSPKPLILAGGLHPGNVAAAIERVRPWGVDVHTGVEDGQGRKDRGLVMKFVAEARGAFQSLSS
jgi:phosphoribosylanthranilate isomerase